jgi:PKD repeat protein
VVGKKSDMSVRELFRRKLGNAELVPDASFNKNLMRKVARKEFIRFNPARFNVYYLSGLIIATVTTGILIFTDHGKTDLLNSLPVSGVKTETVTSEVIGKPAANVITTDTKDEIVKQNYIVPAEVKKEQRMESDKEINVNVKPQRDTANIIPAGINNPIPKVGLLKAASSVDNKLKGSFNKGDILFEPSVNSGCQPLKVHFRNKIAAVDSCKWTFGDGGFSVKTNPDWIFDVEGEYRVGLEVFGSEGFHANYTTIITVHPKPQARFEIVPEKAVIPDDEIRFLNYSTNGVRYIWNFGDGVESELFEPVHTYSKYSNYNVRLVASSDIGCSDTLIVMNAFTGSKYFIEFPNAFIPNANGPSGGYYSSKSDEAAQVFHPSFTGVSEYQLRIFSKQSVLIFESNDINIGWDGYYKGELVNSGVYIWKVRGNFRNGEPFIKMGDVTLLRN